MGRLRPAGGGCEPHPRSCRRRRPRPRRARSAWACRIRLLAHAAHGFIVPRPPPKRPKPARRPNLLRPCDNLCTLRGSRQAPQPERIDERNHQTSNRRQTRRRRGQLRPRASSPPIRRQPPRRPGGHPLSARARTATCTSATPRRSASTSAWRRSSAAPATCASTTPTRPPKTSSTSTPSRRTSAGWGSTGTALYLRVRLLRAAVPAGGEADREGQGLRRQPVRGADPRVPRRLLQARASPAPTATARSPRAWTCSRACARASSPKARTCCARRSISRRRT